MRFRYIALVIYFGTAFAQYRDIPDVVTKVATSAANWLKLETSTRAIGMGGVSVASGRGVMGIPYNPSSIGYIESREAYFSAVNYLAGIQHGVFTFGAKLSPSDFAGFHIFYLNSGSMAVTNEYYPDGTGEEFNVVSMAIRGTYARLLTDRLKIGLSLNYINDKIYEAGMQTMSFDLGSNFDTGIYGMLLGMSITNFGPDVQYDGESLHIQVPDTIDVDKRVSKITDKFPLPLVFRLGVENEIVGPNSAFLKNSVHSVCVSVDGIKPSDYQVYGGVGVEYGWQRIAFIRGGMHLNHDTAGMSFGWGLNLRLGRMKLGVDYAFADYNVLKNTHQFGIGIKF